ncbi:MAG: hypothetical protein GXP45_06610 [bacterium]|nr:hypothetical protein [bacterium]
MSQSDALKRESKLLRNRSINEQKLKIFQEHKIYGLRRSLRVYPEKRMLKFQNDDILMSF